MKYSNIIIFLLLMLSHCGLCQIHKGIPIDENPDVDSLLQLVKHAPEDSVMVDNYHMLAALTAGRNASLAIGYCETGIAMSKKIGYRRGHAICSFTSSYCYGLLNNIPRAMRYLDTAIALYKQIGKPDAIAMGYRTRADYNMKQGKIKQSLADCDTALAYGEKAKSKTVKRYVYRIMANIYFQHNDLEQSKYYYNLAYEQHAIINDLIPMTEIIGKLGSIAARQRQYAQAIGYYERAIEISKQIQQENSLPGFHSELSAVLLQVGNLQRAEKEALLAVANAKQKANSAMLARAQKSLSKVYLVKDSLAAAIQYASMSMESAEGSALPGTRQESAEALAEAYYKKGDLQKAYYYLQLSKSVADSIAADKYSSEIVQMQTQFKVNEKDQQIALLAKTQELQQHRIRQQWYLAVSGVLIGLLALLGAWALVNRNRMRQAVRELKMRNQLAADLHDEVGSSLSSIHLLSQMAGKTGDGATQAQQQHILNRMSSHAKETMERMNDIVWMIKMEETDHGSLQQRIEAFAVEICGSKNITVSAGLQDIDKAKLSMQQRKNIYLIFKEAINNAGKYSGTQQLELQASLKLKQLCCSIRDFGKGMADGHRAGNGLTNMQQRAKDLGAILHISSACNEGTQISFAVETG